MGDLLEPELVFEWRHIKTLCPNLLEPRFRPVVMLLDECSGEREELGASVPAVFTRFCVEVADVKKNNDQVVKRAECLFFDWEGAIAIGLISTLDLNTHPLR